MPDSTTGRPQGSTAGAEHPGGKAALPIAVVIASAGRPELLREVVADLQRQTRQDFTVVVSVPDDDSLPDAGLPSGTVVVHGERGTATQRNTGLEAVPDATYVFCFDDDTVVREDFIERAVMFFDRHPDVVGITGRVLLDGAASNAVPREEADRALAASLLDQPAGHWQPSRELYGCNLAFRADLIGGERFDGRLPLYSWLEDHDFARRLMRHGSLAKVEDCVVVHRGVKSGGRMAHERLGYAQVMNPAYLYHVGSFPLWLTLHEALPRFGKNIVLSVVGPESSWRRERLRGNLRAAADIALRRFTPERILQIPAVRDPRAG